MEKGKIIITETEKFANTQLSNQNYNKNDRSQIKQVNI